MPRIKDITREATDASARTGSYIGLDSASNNTEKMTLANFFATVAVTGGTIEGTTIDPSNNTIDGDVLDITFTPSNYTPDASPAEAADVDDLAAHLKGIDTAISNAGTTNNTTADFIPFLSGGAWENSPFHVDGTNIGLGTEGPKTPLHISGSPASFNIQNTDAAADNQAWAAQVTGGGNFRFRAVDDAFTTGINALVFERSGTSSVTSYFQNGNVGFWTTDQFGSGDGVLGIADASTAPTTNPTAGVVVYSTGGEFTVRDSAGNTTTLSPHRFDLTSPSHEMAWSYHSEKDGKTIEVDMLRVVRLLEEISGEQLVFMEGVNA